MAGEAAREAKHLMVSHEMSNLTREVRAFEEFLEKLSGGIPEKEKLETIALKQPSVPCLSFAEVYGTLPASLHLLRERLTKARLALEELLI